MINFAHHLPLTQYQSLAIATVVATVVTARSVMLRALVYLTPRVNVLQFRVTRSISLEVRILPLR